MTDQEIKGMIERYGMTKSGDKIRMSKNLDEARTNIEAIKAAKPEIMSFFEAEEAARRSAFERKEANFFSIPGVRELRDAREEWANYRAEFNRAMDRVDGRLPVKPSSDPDAIAVAYPGAVFALMVQYKSCSANYQISAIAGRAYEALRNGGDLEQIKQTYEAEMDQFTLSHMWD